MTAYKPGQSQTRSWGGRNNGFCQQGGLEVLKVLRFRPATAALPVLVLTALDDEANTRAGFDLGATDYLTKPFSIPQLAARVRACLSRREPVETSRTPTLDLR